MKPIVLKGPKIEVDTQTLSIEKFVFLVHYVYKDKGTSKVPKNALRAYNGI
jgi:hypothetical protein